MTIIDSGPADDSFACRNRWIGAQPRDTGKRSSRHVALLMIVILCVLTGCTKTAPEQALRQTVAQMQQAASEKDVSGLMKSVAEDFNGSQGMDQKQFRQYVSLLWLQHQQIGIQMGPLDVKLTSDDRATVNFTVVLSGGDGLIPNQGQIYQVQTGWRLEGSDWRLISADWKQSL
jgi:outer membrane biogenesis lipoprotein LolB